MFLQHLCTPALVLLAFGTLGSLGTLARSKTPSKSFISFLASLASTLILTYVLDYVCKHYGVTNAWYILAAYYILIPIILSITLFIILRSRM